MSDNNKKARLETQLFEVLAQVEKILNEEFDTLHPTITSAENAINLIKDAVLTDDEKRKLFV